MSYGEENQNSGVLSRGAGLLFRNFRYVVWFFILNVALGWFGVMAFAGQAHSALDHSMYADRLTHGFDLSVLAEFLARPETGSIGAAQESSAGGMIAFFLATAVLLPGVFQGYASKYRLPRDEFFRACGRNLWRYIRLLLIWAVVASAVSVPLFIAYGALVDKATENTNELLPFETKIATLAVIFLVMTTLRIAFDLAEIDVVLNDQNAVRKSVIAGFRHMWHGFTRLFPAYILITFIAATILCGGLWLWVHLVPSESLHLAFVVSQLTLFLLLIPRFWQRGVAVSYWERKMMAPLVPMESIAPASPLAPALPVPMPQVDPSQAPQE